jgi:WD40 repeat protein
MKKQLLVLGINLPMFFLLACAQGDEPSYKYLFSFRHDDIITCATYSGDGRWLATGSELGTVMISDMQSRREFVIKNPNSRGNGVQTLRFSPDGKLLLVGGYGNNKGGGEIQVLRTGEYTVTQSLDTAGAAVDFLDISPDNKWLISGEGRSARIWKLQDKRLTWSLSLADSTLRYDGDRTLLIGVGKVGRVANLEVKSGGEEKPATTAVATGQIVLFDIIDGKVTRILRTLPEEPVRRVILAKANKQLFALTDGGTVYRIDRKADEIKQRIALPELYRKVSKERLEIWRNIDFQVLENHPILVFNDRTHTIFVNYETNKVIALDHESMVGIQFSPSGKEFALLGGVKRESLTGIPDQHYWTVNLFSFNPF